MKAVITADLIDSTQYRKSLLEKVLTALNQEFINLGLKSNEEYQFYRGDSFQLITTASKALNIALRLKSLVIKTGTPANLRLAIGIGKIEYPAKKIAEANGEAFRFSGLSLDEMKYEPGSIRLKTPGSDINAEFRVHFLLLEEIMQRWSTASAEVIYYLLQSKKEAEIAEILSISQSAVNQRKKTAAWHSLQALLKHYENLIPKKLKNG